MDFTNRVEDCYGKFNRVVPSAGLTRAFDTSSAHAFS